MNIYNYTAIRFSIHTYPFDFLRHEIKDILKIFFDFIFIKLKKIQRPLMYSWKAKKPSTREPSSLPNISLFYDIR
jgi:hypothetical protein